MTVLVGDPAEYERMLASAVPLGITRQTDRPCQMHKTHSPLTVINEGHHMFPIYLQHDAFGDKVIHEPLTDDVCGTGHNNIHTAINLFFKGPDREWPRWCIRETREWASFAVIRWAEAKDVDPMDPTVRPKGALLWHRQWMLVTSSL